MKTVLALLEACVESGTLLVAFCALVLVPFAIWALSRLSLPLLREIDDHRRRALCAGLLAIAPGASFAVAAVIVIVRAIRAGCLEMLGGRVVVAAIAVLLAAAFARAVVRAWARQRRVDELIAGSSLASPRLRASAETTAFVHVREIVSAEPVIFVAGIRRPTVFVSQVALSRLSDAELAAALAHERAHARHGDQLIMSTLLFFSDLLPLGVERLTELYRDAREFAADCTAIQTSDPVDLAAAILRVVSSGHARPIAALAEACVRARLVWLLEGATSAQGTLPVYLKLLAAAQIALLVALAVAAVILPACRIAA